MSFSGLAEAGRVEVKICGVRDRVALEAAATAGADWVGLVFFPPSPRALTPDGAAALLDGGASGPGRVGLFVKPTEEEIAATLAVVKLDALQLHASPERVDEIGRRFGLPVWHAVGIDKREDLRSRFGGDRSLIEAKPPAGATRPGGNAQLLDWTLTAGWRAEKPWLLAGGLTPGNVERAIRVSGAPGVDVSSGVETALGEKSPTRIAAFVAAARASPTIGYAAPREAEAVSRAHVAAWRETYPDMLPSAVFAAKTVDGMSPLWAATLARGEAVFVARDEAGIAGVACAGALPRTASGFDAEIRALYLLRRAQRRGLGRALMGAMAGDLLDRGLRSACLLVLEANTRARNFYAAMGGRVVGAEVQDGVAHLRYGWDDVSLWLHPPTVTDSAAGCAA